jgi:adenine-specific DNA-methyltransferase
LPSSFEKLLFLSSELSKLCLVEIIGSRSKRPNSQRARRSHNGDLPNAGSAAKSYQHPDQTAPQRPDIGTQAQFRKRKEPTRYSYDSSLSPGLDWDGQNAAREQGERLIREILDAPSLEAARDAARKLARLSKPFLNWTGKAERLSFDVPSLPLFVHERLSTSAILETLRGHRHDAGQRTLFDLFGDPERSITDQILKPYEHGPWQNRVILGDSLVVMNSLLEYEGMGGKVQMIYMDPPYGVRFGSNFQPFVRKRDVTHGDDEDRTREPEMVQAYRDTWELGLHSYLAYLRDRLKIARELLTPSGSVFVQISDENVHHVREVMDEVFGSENFASLVTFQKTTGSTTATIPTTSDYLLWYAKELPRVKYRKLYTKQTAGTAGALEYKRVELADGTLIPISQFIEDGRLNLPDGARVFATDSIVSKGGDDPDITVEWQGKTFVLSCKPNRHWKPGVEGIRTLWNANRLLRQSGLRIYKRYFDDFSFRELTHVWNDTRGEDDPHYVVETHSTVVERCVLMTTDPGDLVLDPTCGSGTTAYVAEQWGRRWITCDVSRVPLALARQRLLTATFPYYQLVDEARGPSGGFIYKRKQNRKGEEVGGIVPHITLKSIANNEPPEEEVLVDRPEIEAAITRITGPFCFESTIPAPLDLDHKEETGTEETSASLPARMIEILRKSPVLRLAGNQTITLKNIRPPAKSLSLSAEAVMVNGDEKTVALVFGPENGSISERLVYDAAREANIRGFERLLVIGFAIEAAARQLIERCEDVAQIPATYIQATPDLIMTDLLKNMRSSQIFSVCGLPDVRLRRLKTEDGTRYQVELLGLDTFDPVSMDALHRSGNDVPVWFLDCDYNELCFHVSQAFFPRTSAWDNLKKALRATHQETVWDHLSGTTSAPFEAGVRGQIAVKVIDDRGNELLVVKKLSEAEA